MTHRTLLFLFLLAPAVMGGEANQLEPILAKPGEVFLKMDFDEDFTVGDDHPAFRSKNGTRWAAKEGVLLGIESTAEYQAEKTAAGDGHTGTAPQLIVPGSPRDVILKYSFKIVGGKLARGMPMIESGHHFRYLRWAGDGTRIPTGREKVKTLAESDFVLEFDHWYHVMIEIKGDEFLARFQDGPTLYGRDESVAVDVPNYDIRLYGTDNGLIQVDNMTIWHAGETADGWPVAREALLQK